MRFNIKSYFVIYLLTVLASFALYIENIDGEAFCCMEKEDCGVFQFEISLLRWRLGWPLTTSWAEMQIPGVVVEVETTNGLLLWRGRYNRKIKLTVTDIFCRNIYWTNHTQQITIFQCWIILWNYWKTYLPSPKIAQWYTKVYFAIPLSWLWLEYHCSIIGTKCSQVSNVGLYCEIIENHFFSYQR